LQEQREAQEILVSLVRLDSREAVVQLVILELPGRLDHQDHKVLLVILVHKVKVGSELQAQLARRDLLDSLEQLVNRE